MFRIHLMVALLAALAFAACDREPEVAAVDTAGTVSTAADTAVVTPAEVRSLGWGAWHDWDIDANKLVNRDEFNRRFTTVYTGWAGTDNTFAADEAADTWRDWFDRNNDDIIDNEEWQTATTNWRIRDVNWGEFSAWDVDRNNRLDANEWRTGFGRAAANARWGRDELADTWWDWWDANDDNMIDENEWQVRSRYWQDNA